MKDTVQFVYRPNTTLVSKGRLPWYRYSRQKTLIALYFTSRIIKNLKVPWVVIISMDSFYKALTKEQRNQAYANRYNFDHPNAFDFDILYQRLVKLKQGKAVEIPIYDFTTHSRMEKTQTVYGANVIIFEGIFAFYDPKIVDLMDLKIFVDTDADVRLARRLKRDISERGRDLNGVLDQYGRFVKPAFDDYIQPTVKNADVIIPRGLENVVAIDLITKHIQRELNDRLLHFRWDLARTDVGEGLPSSVIVLEPTNQVKGMHTIIRDKNVSRDDFIFYAERLSTLIIESAMSELPFEDVTVVTPTGVEYAGKKMSQQICGVSILRAGSTMETGLMRVIPDVKLGKLLIQTDPATGEPQLHYLKLPPDVQNSYIFLMDATIGTGAAGMMAIRVLLDHEVPEEKIIFLNFLASLQGLNVIAHAFPKVARRNIITVDAVVMDEEAVEHSEERPLLSPTKDTEEQLPWHKRWRKPHLGWMLVFSVNLSIISTAILSPLVQLVLRIVCESEYIKQGFSEVPTPEQCRTPSVQSIASQYMMWYTLLMGGSVMITIGYLSSMSDKRGRRFVFITAETGLIISISLVILTGHFWQILTPKFLLLAAVIDGLMGGIIAINTACHAYIADCVSAENRSFAFAAMHATAFLGMTVGPIVGGMIAKATSSLLAVFYFSLSAHTLFLLFVIFLLPESVSTEQIHASKTNQASFSITSIFTPMKILHQIPEEQPGDKRPAFLKRLSLYLLAMIYFIYKLTTGAQNEVVALYTAYCFHWTALEQGFFFSLQSATKSVALVLLIPALKWCQTWWRRRRNGGIVLNDIDERFDDIHDRNAGRLLDTLLLRTGLVMEVIGFAAFALAAVPSLFYAACVVNSLSTIATPAIRSLFILFVHPSQAGQILGSLSVVESIGAILSPIWMNSVYSWTVHYDAPQTVFWVTTGLFTVALALACGV
ncbi:hypothetical protein BZG36_04659 [Bifiguratus adelaidae]|uniref:uridine/cytidine kinase n=1 Tax=Bifiguratus adelaidae TaxID=1938954 RepID=A0A261Y0B1_9FUNG|nr:hypothetical protein BZG36_04659 [Bifiguratus adelaidae]